VLGEALLAAEPEAGVALRLLPIAVGDWLLRRHVETNGYVDPVTGDPIEFDELPEVHDPEGDEDPR
jgi:hypothetical protein